MSSKEIEMEAVRKSAVEMYGDEEKLTFGDGNLKAKILFVGLAPGPDEEAEGLPIAGKPLSVLESMLKGLGVDMVDTYFTNLVPRNTGDRKPTGTEIKKCFGRLSREIEIVDPLVVVALGALPAKALTDVKSRFATFAKNPDSPFMFAKTKGISQPDVKRNAIVTFCPRELVKKNAVELKKGSDLHWLFLSLRRAKNLVSTYEEILGDSNE